MDLASLLIAASAVVMATLGTVHFVYTFYGGKLDPRDPAVREGMQRSHPVITRQTTVWRATMGFNVTHSLGIVAFALIYGYLALAFPGVLAGSLFLGVLGMTVLLAYLVTARRYFFDVPFRGVAIACLLYGAGWALS